MRLKIFSLRFSAEQGGFDDAPLAQFLEGKELVAVTEHFHVVDLVPWLTLIVSYRDVEADERRRPSYRQGPDPRSDLDPAEREVYDAVRAWRAARARQDGVPAYVIASNRQVARMVRLRCTSKTALQKVEGFGDEKISLYGDEVLGVLGPRLGAPPAEPAP